MLRIQKVLFDIIDAYENDKGALPNAIWAAKEIAFADAPRWEWAPRNACVQADWEVWHDGKWNSCAGSAMIGLKPIHNMYRRPKVAASPAPVPDSAYMFCGPGENWEEIWCASCRKWVTKKDAENGVHIVMRNGTWYRKRISHKIPAPGYAGDGYEFAPHDEIIRSDWDVWDAENGTWERTVVAGNRYSRSSKGVYRRPLAPPHGPIAAGWEVAPLGDIIQKDWLYWSPEKKAWVPTIMDGSSHCFENDLYIRPVTEWRVLQVGEIIQRGDQIQAPNGDTWIPVSSAIGLLVSLDDRCTFRRKKT